MRVSAAILSFWITAAFISEVAEAQWLTGHDAVFQPLTAKPAVSVPFVDPKFKTQLRRLTDARGQGIASIVPQYSKRQAWNADQSILLLFTGDGAPRLYHGSTYAYLKTLDGVGGEDVFWHPTDPSIIYYSADNVLYSYNVNSEAATPLHTFEGYTWTNTRGEGNISRDGRYYAFVGQTYDTDTHFKDIVVYDLVLDSVVSKLALPAVLSDFDWASISPLGDYVVVDYATQDTGRYQGIEVYDRNLNFIWQKGLGAGHSDLGIDAQGDQVLVISCYDADLNRGIMKKLRLADGTETDLLQLSESFDMHISCRNEVRSEWCFVSTFDGEGRLTDDSLSWLPFEDEIFALKLDGSGSVQRIAHHHSRRFTPSTPDRDNSNYWAEPHATVSRDGMRMVFGSNWREDVPSDSSVDTYVVDFTSFVSVREAVPPVPGSSPFVRSYPNPFNESTTIVFTIPPEFSGCKVELSLYDLKGQRVRTFFSTELAAGTYSESWNGTDDRGKPVASGIYLCGLNVNGFIGSGKIVLLK